MTTRQDGINALNTLQSKLSKWQRDNFKEDDCRPEWMIVGAIEELGEASHVLLKSRQKIRKYQNGFDDVAREDLKDAIADAVIYIMQLCSRTDIAFGDTLFRVVDEVLERNWIDRKKDGVTK
jgi:NTP pyrophosphatase (non-canonical NTP hydrolase)